MAKELVISSNRHETKVAVLEDDQLVEIYFQRSNEYSLAGSIHKGRVTRVLPGMQSAFVDIGLDRDAFLYVSDFYEEQEEYDKMPAADQPPRRPSREPAVPPARAASGPVPETAESLRDRRGRRSRRRRSRGRELPDSKYAAPPPPSGESDLELLPGETLAKYQGDEPEERAALDALDALEAVEAEAASSEQPPQGVRDLLEEFDAAEAAPGEQFLPGAQAALLEEPPEGLPLSPQSPGDLLDSLQAKAEALAEPDSSAEVPPSKQAFDALFSESPAVRGPEPEPLAPAEPLAAQVMPEGTAPAEPAAGSWAEQQEASVAEPASFHEEEASLDELPPGSEAADMAPSGRDDSAPAEELSANLREPSPRLPHRVSRRMRRKMRNGSPAERRNPEPSLAAAPAPPQTVVAPEPEKPVPSIADLLREGQEILVQIAKEPLGQKGARITSFIALPGRYVVYMPTVDHPGVSRKISSEEERARLRRIIQTHRAGMPGGFIVRTAGEGKPEREIAADMMYLYNLWLDIRQKAEKRSAPVLIHHDLDIVQRILRDQLSDTYKSVWLDNEETYESVLRFVERVQPALIPRVKLYTRSTPIFDAFNITAELEKALRPKVWLKSGGYIVVNQTEALVAIDVNTGKFVGMSNRLEDTIVKTNIEAIREIVRQIRLRDLGGIIVVDFIDMDERKNRQKVMQALEEEMRRDRAPYKILQFNDFGLVAITRKRVKQSLERTLCAPCPYCEGAGYVKSVQTVVSEILQEARKIAGAVEGPNVVLRVNPEVAKVLKASDNDCLEELEEILRRPVLVTGDPLLHQEKWDMA